MIFSKVWDPYNLNFTKNSTVIEDNQFVVKTSNTSQRVFSINNMGPKMVSVAKMIDNE